MALEKKDRVKDQTTTTGTGTVTIDGVAATGYRTITAAHTTGATVRYTIANSALTEWEVGEGVWTAAGTTLTRVTVYASSNAGALVNFSSGTKTVFTTPTAQDFVPDDVIRSARTSNTILAAADKGTLIDVTSGTFSQTFTAAATLGSGWWCYYRNRGTGEVTLDPNAAETIDGLTTFKVYGQETRLIQCDGSNFNSVVLSPFYVAFTTEGANTFTKPPGYSYFRGLLWGGGGSGAKASSPTGGGGGAYVRFELPASVVGTTETITVGATATGPSSNGVGTAGNNSTFGSLITSYGGGGGVNAANSSGGGGGGIQGAGQQGQSGASSSGGAPITAAGVLNIGFGGAGSPASGTIGLSAVYGGGSGGGHSGGGGGTLDGGASVYGGGGGGNALGIGGVSTFGGSGGAGGDAVSGTNGTAPGGAGGATKTGAKAGDGARGECRIWGVV